MAEGITINIEHRYKNDRKFAIYRSDIGETIDYHNPENIVGIVYNEGDSVSFLDEEVDSEHLYAYGVTSLSITGVGGLDEEKVDGGHIHKMNNRNVRQRFDGYISSESQY